MMAVTAPVETARRARRVSREPAQIANPAAMEAFVGTTAAVDPAANVDPERAARPDNASRTQPPVPGCVANNPRTRPAIAM